MTTKKTETTKKKSKKETVTKKAPPQEPQDDNISRIFSMNRTADATARELGVLRKESAAMTIRRRELTKQIAHKEAELISQYADLSEALRATSVGQYKPKVVVK